jgi:hypothetical protein
MSKQLLASQKVTCTGICYLGSFESSIHQFISSCNSNPALKWIVIDNAVLLDFGGGIKTAIFSFFVLG